MPRQLRIEFPGAFYHVYSRGNQKQPIFYCDEDRCFFLKLLREAQERHDAIWRLYCLMPNHYHLGLVTPKGNLSQIMHFINSSFSMYLNLKHKRCGHLFQGRFKAILVQEDCYARTLTKYIHSNPVLKGLAHRPEEFGWSSCGYYFGLQEPPSWLETTAIRNCFGNSTEVLKNEHEDYLRAGEDLWGMTFRKASKIGIMGNDDFVAEIRRIHLSKRLESGDEELSELKRLRRRPELAQIRRAVEEAIGQQSRLIKRCTIFIAHGCAGYKLREVGAYFGIKPSAASTAFRRTVLEIASNPSLEKAVEQVKINLQEDSLVSKIVKV